MELDITKEELEMFKKFKAMLALEANGSNQSDQKKRKITKHRRSRGTGTITKLSGNRKKPFVAKITVGHDKSNGNQIQQVVGYFKSYQDAEMALNTLYLERKGLIEQKQSFNNTANNTIINKSPTFKEIWDIVNDEQISKKSYSTRINYKVACDHLKKIWHMPIDKITLHELQPIFDDKMKEGSGASKMNTIKSVCKAVFTYAMKYDYISKDYSQFITFEDSSKEKKYRITFNKEEIQKLFEANTLSSKIVLIYIYTGLRPQELLNIQPKDVHLEEGYMIGGIKTSNGIDRIIPIHNCIKPFIKELYEAKNKYLVYNFKGRKAYEKYRSIIFPEAMSCLNQKHEPYETRHTFATLCEENNLNEFLVKKMMGHSCNDLTKDVYTHASIERLVQEVNKLPDYSKVE